MNKDKIITEEKLYEIVKNINSRWNERYPNYVLIVDKKYDRTRIQNGKLINFDNISDDQLKFERTTTNRICCLNGVTYILSILNKKNNTKYTIQYLSNRSYLRPDARGLFKRFVSRVASELFRQLEIPKIYKATLSIEETYTCKTEVDSSNFELIHASGKISRTADLYNYLKDREFIDPIVKTQVKNTYIHTIK